MSGYAAQLREISQRQDRAKSNRLSGYGKSLGYLQFPIENDERFKGQVVFTAKDSQGNVADLGSTSLYLPRGINFSDAAAYDNIDLGLIGVAAEAGGKAAVGQSLSKLSEQAASDATALNQIAIQGVDQKNKSGFAEVDDLISKLTTGDISATLPIIQRALPLVPIGGQELEAGLRSATRTTANPHKRSLFRDVGMRTFNFSFSLAPSSAEEANAVNQMIKFFRFNLYPERILGKSTYRFPSVFEIKFYYNGEMDNVPKIKDCYLVSFATNFNPNNGAMFEDGNFSETEIALTFQEERPLDRDDIVDGF